MRRQIIVFFLIVFMSLMHPAGELHAGPALTKGKAQRQPVKAYSEIGKASHYRGKLHFTHKHKRHPRYRTTITAAHRTLPFGTKVKVTNLSSGKSVIVVINDRGPFIRGRVIDLSTAAFKRIGDLRKGIIRVKLQKVAA